MNRQAVRLIIVDDDNEVLLGKSARSGSIKFLGGGIGDGETPVAAAVRELAEEAKIKLAPESLQLLGELVEIISHDNPDIIDGLKEGETQQASYFLAHSNAKAQPGDEIAGLVWVKSDAVLGLLTYPTQKEAYSQLFLGQEASLSAKQWTLKVN